jgi:hypothetical protein
MGGLENECLKWETQETRGLEDKPEMRVRNERRNVPDIDA